MGLYHDLFRNTIQLVQAGGARRQKQGLLPLRGDAFLGNLGGFEIAGKAGSPNAIPVELSWRQSAL